MNIFVYVHIDHKDQRKRNPESGEWVERNKYPLYLHLISLFDYFR